MFQKRCEFVFLIIFFLFLSSASGFSKDDLYVLKDPTFRGCSLVTDSQDLLIAAKDALRYLDLYKETSGFGSSIREGRLKEQGVSLNDSKEALRFLVKVLEQDKGKKYQRVHDPEFLTKNFKFLRWNGDSKQASANGVRLPTDKIYLTKYMTFLTDGDVKKSSKYPFALYGRPYDEKSLSEAQVQKNKSNLTRFGLTKQDVIHGAIDKSDLAKPLVWLNREGLEEALMQGTISVKLPTGKTKCFEG